jgi:hypothetical protein
MPIGPAAQVPEEITDLGFQLSEKIHILGMGIDREVADLDANFDRTIINLKKCTDYWKRYNLTLAGRINVIKSLLFSQIFYLGSFLMPSQEKIKNMQKILDDFATGYMNFARSRVTDPVEYGGLGLFDVEKFLISQQATWIFKAHRSSRDNWRYKLRSLCNGNVLTAGTGLLKKSANPVLHGLSMSYENFRKNHDGTNCNFQSAFVLNNPMFFRGPGDKLPLNLSYLGLAETGDNPITRLTAREFFNVNGLKSRILLLIDYGVDISVVGYIRLARCLNHYVTRLRPNNRNDGSCEDIPSSFAALKKPGKKIRLGFFKRKRKKFLLEDQKFSKTFILVSGSVFPGEQQYSKRISLWNISGIPNRIRTFLFRFYNNILGINTRLSHFVPNQSRACTFCTIVNIQQNADETFSHIFYDCPTVRSWHNKFFERYLPENYIRDEQDRKNILFLGTFHNEEKDNSFLLVSVLIFQFCIWDQRLKKKIISYNSIEAIFKEIIYNMLRTSSFARKECSKTNFKLCRLLGHGGHDREGQHVPDPPPLE